MYRPLFQGSRGKHTVYVWPPTFHPHNKPCKKTSHRAVYSSIFAYQSANSADFQYLTLTWSRRRGLSFWGPEKKNKTRCASYPLDSVHPFHVWFPSTQTSVRRGKCEDLHRNENLKKGSHSSRHKIIRAHTIWQRNDEGNRKTSNKGWALGH